MLHKNRHEIGLKMSTLDANSYTYMKKKYEFYKKNG